MKIIEAMKQVKANIQKITDLQKLIAENSAILSHETPRYKDQAALVNGWAQSVFDLGQDNIKLLCRIQKTNLNTTVEIIIGAKKVTHTIAEWVWRRRLYAATDLKTWSVMTDRGLKEGKLPSSTGEPLEVKINRFYDPLLRDVRMEEFKSEAHLINGTLEVVNAITDLLD